MDAVILAGGKGTRMQEQVPKPLVNVKGKPILFHQIDYLFGKVDRIVLSIGYRGDEIEKAVREHYNTFHYDIYFSHEDRQLGTAGGLKKALSQTARHEIIALNCDDITDIKISDLEKLSENTICVAHPRMPFGTVERDENGYAIFREKEMLQDKWVSCGWYKFNLTHKFSDRLPDSGMLEYDVFPNGRFRMYEHEGFWRPLDSKKALDDFELLEDYPSKRIICYLEACL